MSPARPASACGREWSYVPESVVNRRPVPRPSCSGRVLLLPVPFAGSFPGRTEFVYSVFAVGPGHRSTPCRGKAFLDDQPGVRAAALPAGRPDRRFTTGGHMGCLPVDDRALPRPLAGHTGHRCLRLSVVHDIQRRQSIDSSDDHDRRDARIG